MLALSGQFVKQYDPRSPHMYSPDLADLDQFVGIIAVNFPVLKPFFSKAKNAVSSAKSSKEYASNPNYGLRNSLRLSHVDRAGKKRTVHAITEYDNESEEGIVNQGSDQNVFGDDTREGNHGLT